MFTARLRTTRGPAIEPADDQPGRKADLILADLDVSRYHAELRKSPAGSYEIVDLGSYNGTFVDGKRVSLAMLTEHDVVSIGHSMFRLAEGELWQFVNDGEFS